MQDLDIANDASISIKMMYINNVQNTIQIKR